nr:hypothetical protein [Escherichia coli]
MSLIIRLHLGLSINSLISRAAAPDATATDASTTTSGATVEAFGKVSSMASSNYVALNIINFSIFHHSFIEFHIPCRNRYLLRGKEDDNGEKKTKEDERPGTQFRCR